VTPTDTPTLTATITASPTATASSTDTLTPSTTPTALPVLVGDASVEAAPIGVLAGHAEAYPYVATTTGTLSHLSAFVDSTSHAVHVGIGLYSNTVDNHPGTLLGMGTTVGPVAGAWATVAVRPVAVQAGETYWIAVVTRDFVLRLRGTALGGLAVTSAETTLSSLPTTWTTGGTIDVAPASAYGSP
jgi:hypothetical protein